MGRQRETETCPTQLQEVGGYSAPSSRDVEAPGYYQHRARTFIPVQCTGSYLCSVLVHTCAYAGSYLCSVLSHTCTVCWVISVLCAGLYLCSVLGHTCVYAGSYLCSMLGHTCIMSDVRQRHKELL